MIKILSIKIVVDRLGELGYNIAILNKGDVHIMRETPELTIRRKEIGKRVRRHRLLADLSRKELELLVGYAQLECNPGVYIAKIENGIAFPPLDKLRKFHEILDMPYEELIP